MKANATGTSRWRVSGLSLSFVYPTDLWRKGRRGILIKVKLAHQNDIKNGLNGQWKNMTL
jgi:hypothetical protein